MAATGRNTPQRHQLRSGVQASAGGKGLKSTRGAYAGLAETFRNLMQYNGVRRRMGAARVTLNDSSSRARRGARGARPARDQLDWGHARPLRSRVLYQCDGHGRVYAKAASERLQTGSLAVA